LPTQAIKLNGSLDISIDGDGFELATERGFFTVDSPKGISYSREIKFAVDENGYLRTYGRDRQGNIDTSEGNFVLDGQGVRIQVPNNNIDINESGQVVSNGAVVADLIHRPAMNTIGTMNNGRRFERTHINFIQGTLEQTGNNLNFAIDGNGLFKVMTPEGEMYTRNGSFTLNQNGDLVTSEGYPLLGQNGPITLEGSNFGLGTNGQIIVDGQIIDQINITDIVNVNDLDKYGQSYYVAREGLTIQEAPFNGEILQGFLEGSNINPIDEMVNMINIMRSYESSNRAAKAYDEMLQRAVNDIGKL
jgi:flagellar basal-body rod protein FlgG